MGVAAARDVLTLSHHIARPDWLIALESAKVCAHPSIAGDLCLPGGISTLNSVLSSDSSFVGDGEQLQTEFIFDNKI